MIPDFHVTPKTHSRSLGSPGSAHASIMDQFEDSDDEDEEIFLSPSANDVSIDSIQEMPKLLNLDAASVLTNSDEKMVSEERSDTGNSSPTATTTLLEVDSSQPMGSPVPSLSSPKIRITVLDVAYTTYRAMLYYVSLSVMVI